jgi:diaminohydroxyphosphoribosylaminopyrimidine deaminase/5-amino-6-(5-phosphoribosylamino)uracil reductase
MVGALLLHNNEIIGEGFHQEYGKAHAEVNAINNVKDKSLLPASTLYVNLEPCNHQGKTPPCTELIIESGIKKVVIGTTDSHSIVNGRGIENLTLHGIEVVAGVLENECRQVNRRFFTFHENKRPYIILKWAQTKDYFLDRIRKVNDPQQPNWIIPESLRTIVHKWRSEEQAILVGSKTVLCDNPMLTTRLWPGKNPLRIVIDSDAILPESLQIFSEEAQTLVYSKSSKLYNRTNIVSRTLPFGSELARQMLDDMHSRRIQSLIVEGGLQTLQLFIENNLWDEARIFTGSLSFEDGVPAPKIYGKKIESHSFESTSLDILINSSNTFFDK